MFQLLLRRGYHHEWLSAASLLSHQSRYGSTDPSAIIDLTLYWFENHRFETQGQTWLLCCFSTSILLSRNHSIFIDHKALFSWLSSVKTVIDHTFFILVMLKILLNPYPSLRNTKIKVRIISNNTKYMGTNNKQ